MVRSKANLALLIPLTFLLSVTAGNSVASTEPKSEALFSDAGYRVDRYRSPTPEQATGAVTVDTRAMQALIKDEPGLVIIDVINLEFRHNRFLQTEPHQSLSAAHWLPNTGQGELNQNWHDYLINNTRQLTGNNWDQPVAVLCKSDCWLSWNAVKRLSEAGFETLYWYKDGVDSWQNAGLPTQPVDPIQPEFTTQRQDNN